MYNDEEMSKTFPYINEDFTMKLFKKFAGEHVMHKDVPELIMSACDTFWQKSIKSWESYAHHGGRSHLEKSDLQLHMLRLDLIEDYNDFRALVTRYLSFEDVYEVLEAAQPKAISSHKHAKKHCKKLNNSISAGQVYARRTLFSSSLKKQKVSSHKISHIQSVTSVTETDCWVEEE